MHGHAAQESLEVPTLPAEAHSPAADADETMYSAFVVMGVDTDTEFAEIAVGREATKSIEEFEQVLDDLQGDGVDLRGIYDLTLGGFADPAVLLWLRSSSADDLQWAYRQLARVFNRYFDTDPVSADLVVELTELDDEPAGWLSLTDAYGSAPTGPQAMPLDGEDGRIVPIASLAQAAAAEHPVGRLLTPATEAEPEAAAEGDGNDDEDAAATVSLHARIGIGIDAYIIVAEAESPQLLVGDAAEPFGGEVVAAGAPLTGRWVSAAEVFEVLR